MTTPNDLTNLSTWLAVLRAGSFEEMKSNLRAVLVESLEAEHYQIDLALVEIPPFDGDTRPARQEEIEQAIQLIQKGGQ